MENSPFSMPYHLCHLTKRLFFLTCCKIGHLAVSSRNLELETEKGGPKTQGREERVKKTRQNMQQQQKTL